MLLGGRVTTAVQRILTVDDDTTVRLAEDGVAVPGHQIVSGVEYTRWANREDTGDRSGTTKLPVHIAGCPGLGKQPLPWAPGVDDHIQAGEIAWVSAISSKRLPSKLPL